MSFVYALIARVLVTFLLTSPLAALAGSCEGAGDASAHASGQHGGHLLEPAGHEDHHGAHGQASADDATQDCECCDDCLQACASSGLTSCLAGGAPIAPHGAGPNQFLSHWQGGDVRAPPTPLFRPPILGR